MATANLPLHSWLCLHDRRSCLSRLSLTVKSWSWSLWLKSLLTSLTHNQLFYFFYNNVKGLPNFFGYPNYLRKRWSNRHETWHVHSQGPFEQKPIKNFKEKGAWEDPGIAQFWGVQPIISGTAKPTNFCTHIHRIDWNKRPLKILGKVAVGVASDSRNFSGHPHVGHITRSSLQQLSFLVQVFKT